MTLLLVYRIRVIPNLRLFMAIDQTRTARHGYSSRYTSSILAVFVCDRREHAVHAALVALSCGCRISFAYSATAGGVSSSRRSTGLQCHVVRRWHSTKKHTDDRRCRRTAVRSFGNHTYSLMASYFFIIVLLSKDSSTDN